MQCDICQRAASSKLPFNCTTCARDILYQPRLKHAQILLEKERLEKEIEHSTIGRSKPTSSLSASSSKNRDANPAWTVQRTSVEQAVSEEQTQTIHSHIQILRHETEKMNAEIALRKKRLLKRRSALASAKEELSHAQDTAQEPVEKNIRRTSHRWDILSTKTAESRLLLCREAARLYGLQHHKRRKGVRGRDTFLIGGIPIVDLRDLNSTHPSSTHFHSSRTSADFFIFRLLEDASPAEITVSTSHVAHLVHLTSHYLSLKLPAEITLPHRDYPSPTVFSPSSSYTTTRDIPFPGTTPSHSPEASRHKDANDTRPLPRPRVLHLDKPLPVLAKDDQLAYANFVEAITFLAWDIAWLCRTQGLPVGQTSWEDVCAMGRNLHHLLLTTSPQSHPPLAPASQIPTKLPLRALSRPLSANPSTGAPNVAPPEVELLPPFPTPGHFSHNTTYAFLSTATGTNYMRAWRLASAVKAVDRIKAMLLAERTGAEWEILEGEEWAGAAEEEETAAATAALVEDADIDIFEQRVPGAGAIGAGAEMEMGLGQTGILVKPTSRGGGGDQEADRDADSGTEFTNRRETEREMAKANGWMKVKNRSGEGDGSGRG